MSRSGIDLHLQSSSDDERQAIASWLSSLNFQASQNEFIQKRRKGTGEWFLESREFKEWRDGTSEMLWCPGDGKHIFCHSIACPHWSMSSRCRKDYPRVRVYIELHVGSWLIVGIHSRSIVLNHLQALSEENDSVATTFIYCNYKKQAEQTVSNLVASLLKQIIQGRRAISDNIKSFFERHQRQEARPTLDQLTDALISEIQTYYKVFVVVDALDECCEDDATRAMLLEVLRSLPRQVNLMVTSRNLPSIGRDFEGAKRLHIRAKDDDIRAYIEGRIALGPRHLKNLQETIVNTIVENAKGM